MYNPFRHPSSYFMAGLFAVVIFGMSTPSVRQASELVRTQLANVVGMSAGVEENPYNIVAQQLTQKEVELSERERALAVLEEELRGEVERSNRITLLTVVLVGVVLLGLILVNFYLDRKRREERVLKVPEFQTRL